MEEIICVQQQHIRQKIFILAEQMCIRDRVREHRKTVGEKIAPAANENVDILQLAREIYDSRFYENDYHNTTENIISDEIDYSIVIERYIQVVKELFEK